MSSAIASLQAFNDNIVAVLEKFYAGKSPEVQQFEAVQRTRMGMLRLSIAKNEEEAKATPCKIWQATALWR